MSEVLERVLTPEETAMIDRVIQAVVEEAEQGCRYAEKFISADMEAGEYRDGFEFGCQQAHDAISRHVERHMQRIKDEALRPDRV